MSMQIHVVAAFCLGVGRQRHKPYGRLPLTQSAWRIVRVVGDRTSPASLTRKATATPYGLVVTFSLIVSPSIVRQDPDMWRG